MSFREGRMQRRQFLEVLDGAMAWPIAAYARSSLNDALGCYAEYRSRSSRAGSHPGIFFDGLPQLGWTDGRNVRIEGRRA
jgi:hypothetical protein